MSHAKRYAPTGLQAIALGRVEAATEAKDAADAAAAEARSAWLDRMFSASYQGAAHAQVARAARIDPERYRQLRATYRYDDYVAERRAAAQDKHAA